jgi:hypothetical protein
MATAYKVLGQLANAATTLESIYTVPADTSAVVSTIVICNANASARTYRLAVIKNGDTVGAKSYIAYDVTIGANDSTALTLGLTLAAGDRIQGYASAATSISMTAFGSEIS